MRSQSLLAVLPLLAVVASLELSPRLAQAQETVLVVPVRGEGMDTAALDSATASIRRRIEERGFRVTLLDRGEVTGEPTPEQLGELARQRSASYVVDAALSDFAGMTSLQVRLVTPSGAVLGEDANLARPETLPQDATLVLANVLQALPAPAAPASDMDSPFATPGPGQGVVTEPIPQVRPLPSARPRPRRTQTFPERHFWIGGLIEPAMGTNRSALNLLLGARAEYQWRGLTVGVNFDYSYIKDWEPRSDPSYHTMSVFGMIGYQIRLGSDRLSLPLLAGGGYVPGNGGLLRFEAGLSIRPIDRLQIRLIFVCPNFWFLDEEMVLFTSISLGILVGI